MRKLPLFVLTIAASGGLCGCALSHSSVKVRNLCVTGTETSVNALVTDAGSAPIRDQLVRITSVDWGNTVEAVTDTTGHVRIPLRAGPYVISMPGTVVEGIFLFHSWEAVSKRIDVVAGCTATVATRLVGARVAPDA